jgi:hypothetical protein
MPTKFQTDRQRKPDPYKSWAPPSAYDPRQVESGGSSSLRETPLREDEPMPAPPRSAILGLSRNQQTPYGPVTLPEGINTPYGPIGTPPAPNPGKEKAKADTRAIATAAVGAHAAGEGPRGQAHDQAVPPGTATPPMPKHGTGPGAAAETPPRPSAAGGPGPGRTQVKMPDGRFVFVTPDRGADYVGGGGSYASYQDATSGLGAPQAERFMRGRTFSSPAPPQPYSEQVRALANTDVPDLSFEGDAGFGTSPPGSGGPSSGTRRLSGIEQALARRSWLEGRANEEQRQELSTAEVDRQKRLAEQDPLELARIQAQGRMGGDLAKVQLDLRARQAAVEEHQRMSAQIEKAQAALSAAPAGSQDATDLKQYIDYLIGTRREIANLLIGERLTDPRGVGDALGAAFAGLATAGGGAASTTGAR